jgi:hypothetical protein
MRKILLPLLFVLLLTQQLFAAVAFDVGGSAVQNGSGTTATYANHTVGVGANGALVLELVFQVQTVSAITCVWDSGGTNQSMTQIGPAVLAPGGNDMVIYFGLVAPTSGNKSLVCNWTTTSGFSAASASFTGANQAGGTTTFSNVVTNTGSSGTTALSVTNISGGIAVDGATSFCCNLSAPTQTAFGATPNNTLGMGGSYDPTTTGGSVSFAWTLSSSGGWAELGFSIAPPAAAGTAHNLMLMGVGN